MRTPATDLDELQKAFPKAKQATEAGSTFYLLPELALPTGCTPAHADALLCPSQRDGYESRLFFSEVITPPTPRNWNASAVRILEQNWFAISWRTRPGLRLVQMISAHLEAFR